jgi:hypothetical protein
LALETVCKEEWEKQYSSVLNELQEELRTLSTTYTQLIDMYTTYRKEIKEHRIVHKLDFDSGIITYSLGAKRRIGFKQGDENE